jgi:hypothetical protein
MMMYDVLLKFASGPFRRRPLHPILLLNRAHHKWRVMNKTSRRLLIDRRMLPMHPLLMKLLTDESMLIKGASCLGECRARRAIRMDVLKGGSGVWWEHGVRAHFCWHLVEWIAGLHVLEVSRTFVLKVILHKAVLICGHLLREMKWRLHSVNVVVHFAR